MGSRNERRRLLGDRLSDERRQSLGQGLIDLYTEVYGEKRAKREFVTLAREGFDVRGIEGPRLVQDDEAAADVDTEQGRDVGRTSSAAPAASAPMRLNMAAVIGSFIVGIALGFQAGVSFRPQLEDTLQRLRETSTAMPARPVNPLMPLVAPPVPGTADASRDEAGKDGE